MLALCSGALAAPPPAVLPPSIAISFTPSSSITLGNTSGLQFTITNPNASTLTGVGFTDTLPTGLSVPNASATVSGGVVTLTSPTGISWTGGTIAANTQVNFTVTVTGNVVGNYTNTTSVVTSNEGGSGNSASASLTVTGAPTVTTAFIPNSIAYGTATGLQFDILNPGTNVATMTGISFNDTLPANLTVPNASATLCSGTVTLTSPHGISISNASLAPGLHCIFTVTVTGVIAGNYSVPTTVTSTNGGPSNTSSASLTVTGTPPGITTSFTPNSIALGSTTGLQFTITNSNASSLTGVGFTDNLPSGLTVPAANATVCGGTVTLTPPNVISMSGATVSANGNCIFTVTVTGAVVGNYTNTTTAVTSTEAGNGNPATASLAVTGSAPTLTTSFSPTAIAQGATSALTFTITNPAGNAVALTGVGFTNTLPTGLTVPNATATVCGGTVTLTAPTGISMSGATVNANSNCIFAVTVTGAANGSYTNTTSAVTSTNAGAGNTSSASLIVGPGTNTMLSSCPPGSPWSTSACWSLGRAPLTGDDVAISGSAPASTNYDLAGVQLRSLTISGASGALNVTGGPIGLQSGGTVSDSFNNDGTDTLPGFTLNGPATFAVPAATETLRINAAITGTGGLTKTGGGTLLLSGANTYTGTTQVNGGTLSVGGSTGAVTVGSGGTLAGTGTVQSITAQAGGAITGNLTSTGGATFAAGSFFNVTLTNNSTFTQLSGGVTNLSAGPTINVTLASGFVPASGVTFPVIPGTVIGTFNGVANNSFINAGSTIFRVNYASVTLTSLGPAASIPTLSWWVLGLLAILLAALAMGMRRGAEA
jgi:uncharacterized repeat protein (TIGR01451 family)